MFCETTQTDSTETDESKSRIEFDDSDTCRDEMHESLEAWVEQFAELSDEARASTELQKWLDVQSRFHDYSSRNTLLILIQGENPAVHGGRESDMRLSNRRRWPPKPERLVHAISYSLTRVTSAFGTCTGVRDALKPASRIFRGSGSHGSVLQPTAGFASFVSTGTRPTGRGSVTEPTVP